MSEFYDKLISDIEGICRPLGVPLVADRHALAPRHPAVEVTPSNRWEGALEVVIRVGWSPKDDEICAKLEAQCDALFGKAPYKIVFKGGSLTKCYTIVSLFVADGGH